MKKFLLIFLALIAVLVLVVGVGVYFYGNTVIKRVVEQQGTKATGVQTTLGSVALNPFGGALSLNGFQLANPEGFTDSKLFELQEADVEVKVGSLLGGSEIVVPEVNVDGAVILIELSGLKLNTLELLKNIQKQGESDDAGTDGAPADPEPSTDDEPSVSEPGGSKGFLINTLNITNTKVIGRISIPGVGEQDLNLELADIQKTDVRGVELSDVIAFTLETVLLNASQTVSQAFPNFEALSGQLGDVAGQVLDDLGGRVDGVVPGLGEAAKQLGGNEVQNALGGLFGRDDEKPEAQTPPESAE
ncbi:MAG: hypothetical protein AAGG38_01975 [Planctomycetota bacterium]